MRGLTLSFWSPQLYFKAILSAMTWSDQVAQAMESHGFVDDQARTVAHQIQITPRDWVIFIVSLVLVQAGLIALP